MVFFFIERFIQCVTFHHAPFACCNCEMLSIQELSQKVVDWVNLFRFPCAWAFFTLLLPKLEELWVVCVTKAAEIVQNQLEAVSSAENGGITQKPEPKNFNVSSNNDKIIIVIYTEIRATVIIRTNSVHNKHKVVGMSSPSNNSVIIIVHREASSFSNTHTHTRWVLSASAIIQTPTIENNDVSIIVMLQYSDMNRCEIASVIRFCFFSHSPAYALCLFCGAFEECIMA